MFKFHQIPTDTFVPISHDNSYLFNHYDKVANFLAFNLEKNYKNILAKPVQNGYAFDWFSIYENLKSIDEKAKIESEQALVKYWEFMDIINLKIGQLLSSNDDNNKNWADLLTKVFDHKNNFIFSNGTELCIIWGWKFDNNQNYKPNFVSQNNSIPAVPQTLKSEPVIAQQDDVVDVAIDESPEEEIQPDELDAEIIEKPSFLEFLKWFASNYWWLLWLLITLVALVFFIKSLAFKIS
jgi:hypothetical protein